MRILVVDDDPTCNQFLTLLLELEGYDVRAAHTAAMAIQIADEFHPDVLIADWLLKDGMDGTEVARSLKGRRDNLKIIFTTGSPAEQLAEQIRQLPVLRVLEKPIEIDDLLTELRALTVDERCRSVSS